MHPNIHSSIIYNSQGTKTTCVHVYTVLVILLNVSALKRSGFEKLEIRLRDEVRCQETRQTMKSQKMYVWSKKVIC